MLIEAASEVTGARLPGSAQAAGLGVDRCWSRGRPFRCSSSATIWRSTSGRCSRRTRRCRHGRPA